MNSNLNKAIDKVLADNRSDESDVRSATAPHQRDFPYHREEEASSRIAGAEMLAPGSSLNFSYPTAKDSAILVRTLDGEFHGFGQKCTHLSCPVYFERAHQRLECPCHDGAFDAKTGNVLYGPPPRPLDPIKLEVRSDGAVWAIDREAGSSEGPI